MTTCATPTAGATSRARYLGAVMMILGSITMVQAIPTSFASGSLTFTKNQNASPQASTVTQTSAGWNEPAGVIASDGSGWMSFQGFGGSSGASRIVAGGEWLDAGLAKYSTDRGGDSGDVTAAADRANTVFIGHFDSGLQSEIDYTRDGGKTWQTASNVLGQPAQESANPFQIDRPWIAAYSPDSDFHHTKLYLTYHDFFGPGAMWMVACSMQTGSLACGAPRTINGAESACNAIPGGITVAPAGPHAGRVFSVWTTADPVLNPVSGCNFTEAAPFYRILVAYSDNADAGPASTWTTTTVYVGPTNDPKCANTAPINGVTTATCADASMLFTPIATDNAGNAYIAFIDYIDTLDESYDVYLSRSLDGGTTWNGKGDGTGAPIRVDHSPGTHILPAIAAGDAGRIGIGYYQTDFVTKPFMVGETCPSSFRGIVACGGKPHPQPPDTPWKTMGAISVNADSANPTFEEAQASDSGVVVHYGDACNVGIFCSGGADGNRSLLDATAGFVDLAGRFVFGWTDQREDPQALAHSSSTNATQDQGLRDRVYMACEASGPSLLASPTGPSICRQASVLGEKSTRGLGATGPPPAIYAGFAMLVIGLLMLTMVRTRKTPS
ncbi:MAG: hypothetical protein ABR507_10290 [Actinomycetota bacterium]